MSFAKATGPIGYDGDFGDIFLNDVPHGSASVENFIGSDFDDHLTANVGNEDRYAIAHGGKGNDVMFSDQPFASLFGDAGNDTLIGGQNGFIDENGGAGDDILLGVSESNMTGGKGNDIFHLNYGDQIPGGFSGGGAAIHDFKHGQDTILLEGTDPDRFITNDGDLWTVHSPNAVEFATITFQVDGVTELEEGVDFTFVDSVFV